MRSYVNLAEDCLYYEVLYGHRCCSKHTIELVSGDCCFCSHYISTEGLKGEEIFKEVADRCMDPPRFVPDSSGQFYISGMCNERGADNGSGESRMDASQTA